LQSGVWRVEQSSFEDRAAGRGIECDPGIEAIVFVGRNIMAPSVIFGCDPEFETPVRLYDVSRPDDAVFSCFTNVAGRFANKVVHSGGGTGDGGGFTIFAAVVALAIHRGYASVLAKVEQIFGGFTL
jgi:hypothetical protein